MPDVRELSDDDRHRYLAIGNHRSAVQAEVRDLEAEILALQTRLRSKTVLLDLLNDEFASWGVTFGTGYDC